MCLCSKTLLLCKGNHCLWSRQSPPEWPLCHQLATRLSCHSHQATAEDLRQFQLFMVNQGASCITINATITGLRFLFEKTLERHDALNKMSMVYEPRKLPVILSPNEITRLIDATTNLKYKTAFSVAYGAGLRTSEITHLAVTDIDSENMVIHVHQGKGQKDRLTMLSPTLLALLRHWWSVGRSGQQLLNGGWLFPGKDPVNPIGTRMLSRVCQASAKAANIQKPISVRTFRHCFATHLLEQGVDIRVIQVLLGHKQLTTTALYSQVATRVIRDTKSPLDSLNLPTLI